MLHSYLCAGRAAVPPSIIPCGKSAASAFLPSDTKLWVLSLAP
jgi:hypothetical protein